MTYILNLISSSIRQPIAVVFLSLIWLLSNNAQAQADQSNKVRAEWKLAVGDYRYSDFSGTDINLRWRNSDTDLWSGAYRDRDFGSQVRVGADTSYVVLPNVALQPSLQLSSQGFIGGSLNLQVGNTWFAYAGLGRTNLKPYFNLNFDPNDAATYGVGHKTDGGKIFNFFVVADDRLGTHQQDWHLTARLPISEQRWVFDLLYKRGDSEVGPISAWGGSVTWDWRRWFIRAARDPYQNFSAQNAWRLTTGIRFAGQ
jgi:hypothetical protein